MTLFPDYALARRIEMHEVWSNRAHAETQARHYPETGAAVLSIAGGCAVYYGVAALIADATLPAYRRQGAQTALLHARLSAAREAGCDLAMVHTRPGAASQRNVLRAGLSVAYTTVDMIGLRRSTAHV